MRILPRGPRSTSADGAKPSSPIPAPRLRVPSAPLFGLPADDGAYVPRYLPPENRNLLTAYPTAPPADLHAFLAALALSAAIQRRGCRILAGSRMMSRSAFELEAAIGQNLAMLADQDHTPAAVTL